MTPCSARIRKMQNKQNKMALLVLVCSSIFFTLLSKFSSTTSSTHLYDCMQRPLVATFNTKLEASELNSQLLLTEINHNLQIFI